MALNSLYSITLIPRYTVVILLSSMIISGCNSDKSPVKSNTNSVKQVAKVSNSAAVNKTPIPSRAVNENKDSDTVSVTEVIDKQQLTEELSASNSIEKTTTPEVKESTTKVIKKAKPKKETRFPKIEYKKLVYDFGTIVEGDTVDYKFYFTNTGRKALDIKSAKVTCGCTQPSYPFIPIEPGEVGYIGVRYISVGKDGPQTPEITVQSTASSKPVVLKLTGIVEAKKDTVQLKKDTLELKKDTLSD